MGIFKKLFRKASNDSATKDVSMKKETPALKHKKPKIRVKNEVTVLPNVKKLRKNIDVEGLINALKHKKSEIRKDAVYALLYIGDTRATEPLIEVLKDDDYFVRYSVACCLASLGDNKAVEPLIHVLLHDKNIEVREGAAESLGELNDARAAEPLFNALGDGDGDVGHYAAIALGKIEDEGAFNFLCRALLKDFSSELQLRIAETLVETGDEKAIEPLTQYLKDKDEETHQAILKKFSYFTHREDWKGKKNKMFHSVYKVIANRLNIPSDKEPEEIIYEGQNVGEVIERVRTVAIPQTPILTESQEILKYTHKRDSWGTKLQKGTVEDLVNALRPRLKNDLAHSEFTEFSVRIYYPQKCSQVESHFKGTFKGYCIWSSDKELFFCFSPE